MMDENQLRAESNQSLIMQALFESDMLRFKDLQEKTGLSPPTLAKRLKAMEKRRIIKRTKRAGERWPYYTLDNPEYLKEFILPQFIWAVLDEKYPDGTSMENIASSFGEMLLYILFKEKTNDRDHDMAIRGLIEIMRDSVDKWVKKGVNMESPDYDGYYRRYIESKVTTEELRERGEELFEKFEKSSSKKDSQKEKGVLL